MQPRSITQPAVDVQALRKIYPGGVEAVKGIDFEVAAGEVFGLLGPNGAGKSTTLGMLTTTIAPTSGRARVAGHDVMSDPLAARSVSSVVFQDPVVDRGLTGRRNLDIHARLWRVEPVAAARRIAELSETLGLAELLDRPVGGPTAAASGVASRSPARSSPSRRCCSSTNPPWDSIRASATSCST